MRFIYLIASLLLAGASADVTAASADYDCIYNGLQCTWRKTDYTYGADYCGASPYVAGQELNNGDIIAAVAKNGTEAACTNHTSAACCKALDEDPCRRGKKYLQCEKKAPGKTAQPKPKAKGKGKNKGKGKGKGKNYNVGI